MYYDLKHEEKLTDALKVYQERWMNSLPDGSELDNITFSEAFEAKMQRYFVGSSENIGRAKILRFTPTFRRITSLLVASVMFIVIALFSVTALRESFFVFLRNESDVSTVIYLSEDSSFNPNDAFDESFFTSPAGFERTEYNFSSDFFRKTYENKDGNYIHIFQGKALGGGTLQLDTEDCVIESVNELGENAMYFEKEEHSLFWQYGASYYIIRSDLPKDQIIEFALTVEY